MKSQQDKKIKVQFNSRIVFASHNENLLQCLLQNKLEIDHSCGGMGTCGTCKVFVLSGEEGLSQKTDLELEISQERNFKNNERLSCQCEILSEATLKT